ncbi:MAG: hypothetical protein GEV06_08020 [Luteitalea sp.]|nr:hypothetical protein [Luteitalea sp.]
MNTQITAYRSYRTLPPLAGICSFEEAARPGLSVEESVRRLKRHHYGFKRLFQVFQSRLTAEPVYELKMAFSYHSHLCMEHASVLRQRVAEMRTPPLGLDDVPHQALEIFFEEIEASPDTTHLLVGLYQYALPALREGIRRHLSDTNKLADHPTVRLLRIALPEVEEMIDYGREAVRCFVADSELESMSGWTGFLVRGLQSAGALDGTCEEVPLSEERHFEKRAYDGVPQRDERFPDPYNMGVHAEEFLYHPDYPECDKVLMMFYKRLREIDVPEMMASILSQTHGEPWDFYRDMTRQLWDEARHAMMGEVGFVSLGIDWPRLVMINHTWSLGLNIQLTPAERHAVLYFIEQGLMSQNGKRFEWEVGSASDNPLARLFQDYDWADEVLHARIGRDWYVKRFESQKAAMTHGSDCWDKVLMGWREWRERGFTEHRNWWPDLYREACRLRGEPPDPDVLAFAVTYETSRADLQQLPSAPE